MYWTCGPFEGGVFCGGYKCEGCIEDGDACSGNWSGRCSNKSTILGWTWKDLCSQIGIEDCSLMEYVVYGGMKVSMSEMGRRG